MIQKFRTNVANVYCAMDRCVSPFSFLLAILFGLNAHQMCSALHLQGTFRTGEFYKFLVKFGFQKTYPTKKLDTQGYIYGNITSQYNSTYPATLVVVDSSYFVELHSNRTVLPRSNACGKMFNKINTIGWDAVCFPKGQEDFLRKLPCPNNALCVDEDSPANVVSSYQFTYEVQDTKLARFWYVSLVACELDSSNQSSCFWKHDNKIDVEMRYDIWLVNGNPYTKHNNPFEHQFSFEDYDEVEIYLAVVALYIILSPVQLYASRKLKHPIPRILSACVVLEGIGALFPLVHDLKFAYDGVGVKALKPIGDFVDMTAQCLFMLLLMTIAKGWGITCISLPKRSKVFLYGLWSLYLVINIILFIWNLTAVDVLSNTDEWETWPGYLTLAFRVLFMLWFLIELLKNFRDEVEPDKQRFYLHFTAGFLVWFVYLPIAALVASQISALYKPRVLLCVQAGADFVSYCVLVHMLWPSRAAAVFSLKPSSSSHKRLWRLGDDDKRDILLSNSGQSDDQSDGEREVFSRQRMSLRPVMATMPNHGGTDKTGNGLLGHAGSSEEEEDSF